MKIVELEGIEEMSLLARLAFDIETKAQSRDALLFRSAIFCVHRQCVRSLPFSKLFLAVEVHGASGSSGQGGSTAHSDLEVGL